MHSEQVRTLSVDPSLDKYWNKTFKLVAHYYVLLITHQWLIHPISVKLGLVGVGAA